VSSCESLDYTCTSSSLVKGEAEEDFSLDTGLRRYGIRKQKVLSLPFEDGY
jgi:hypothetical protein